MGITHVLNTAQGPERQLNLVDTSDDYYDDVGIKFMGIFALDLSSFNISKYFKQCSDFIEDALANNGKVFVHCMQGISRSATIVLAFLMMKRGMNIRDACREVRKAREIFPNDGFLYQLCLLQDSPELNARPAILGKP
ncbi:DUSP3 [Cordylochernes scorpioides]|uniref:protein-serine/threonine phosphatase n=1 Tax=Cordylochernes scorpioides TaxID=51811 RepID=A0ABY6LW13_9ARAC|nr:DUSP3 [Cordylochernes scorpioides]